MENYVGLSGVIEPNVGMGIIVKSIQADVNTYDADGVWVAISGSFGGFEYTFNAMRPVEGTFKFAKDEIINIYYDDGGTAGELMNVNINYIQYGDNLMYMQADPSRVHRTPRRLEWAPPSGF